MSAFVASAAAPRWYVVRSQPHREFHAERNLLAQGFVVFLPTEWRTTRHARRFLTAKAPLFPRYLFVELDLGRDRWRSVNGTVGVAGMIMEGEQPKPVPRGLIEGLLTLRGPTGILSFASELHSGQPVRLVSGPFAGAIGTLGKLTSSERVQVLLNLMGSQVVLSIARKAVAPAA